jgi:monovalent cation:H+ antiporter-2, CPA2 family
MGGGLFAQAFVYLCAALLVVPLASRLGLGSVLGYLIGGVVIGPFGLGLVGDSADVMHFAEFGVVMMLFLVGLELDPSRLWKMRGPIFGMGGAQVGLTALIVAGVALARGEVWQQGLALGLILAMSSTAIALQTLAEKGLLKSDAGQKSFSVLLFQDVAVIPMLAVFPLLATLRPEAAGADDHGSSFVAHLPGWQHALVVVVAIAFVVVAGRFLVKPLMRTVARTGLREMFTAAALLIVIGVTLLMGAVGLSPALGTFLAGVVLANSEYRHELESDVEPFKGLLLGLFFLAVGASIDFALIAGDPLGIAGSFLLITLVKLAVLYRIGRFFGASREQAALFAVALCQVGEFAFVLLNFASGSGVLPVALAGHFVAVTALSMAMSPLLLVLAERVVLPRLRAASAAPAREADAVDEENPVIVAGYGRFGQIATRFLRANGYGATVLDVDSDQIEMLKRFGQRVYFGDASRLDLLRAAGAERAKLLVVAVDDPLKVEEIVHMARSHFPHLAVLARARGRVDAYALYEAGVEGVYRETFDASLRMGVDAMRLLGASHHRATRAARTFRRHDEAAVRELASLRTDQAALIHGARERLDALERVLRRDLEGEGDADAGQGAWDTEGLRSWALSRAAPPRPPSEP